MADSGKVVVIGGGISGLACAYRLKQLGADVTLLEADDRAGGLIGTVTQNGFLFETGPQSFQGTETLLGLIRELGIEGELRNADPRAPRYVLRKGQLQKIPMSPQAMLGTSLLGFGSRWRIVSEVMRTTRPPNEEESIAAFVRRKFGHEILEYLVSPFVSGVYAGDPEKLSLRAAFPSLEEWEREYGSILRGAMKSRSGEAKGRGTPPLCSFREGLGALTRAIATALGESGRTGARVESLSKNSAGGRARYQIRFVQTGREEALSAQAVVIATPAYTASHIVRPISEAFAQMLSGIEYAPVAVVGTGYYNRQAGNPPDGFGVLIPRSEGYRTLGIVWNSSLFAGRAPDGQMALSSFIGGATDPEVVEKPDGEIEAIVRNDIERILGIAGAPIVSAVWKHPKALPQYNLGHGHIIEDMRLSLAAQPGLYLAGNYLAGPSIGKCVDQSYQTAAAVHAYLQGPA